MPCKISPKGEGGRGPPPPQRKQTFIFQFAAALPMPYMEVEKRHTLHRPWVSVTATQNFIRSNENTCKGAGGD